MIDGHSRLYGIFYFIILYFNLVGTSHHLPLTLCFYSCRICHGLFQAIHGWTLQRVMLLYDVCLLGIPFAILMLAIVRYTLILFPSPFSLFIWVFILTNSVFVAGPKLCCSVTITCHEDRRRRVLDASSAFGKCISPWLLHNQLVWMPCWAAGFQRFACSKMSSVSLSFNLGYWSLNFTSLSVSYFILFVFAE